MVIMLFGGRFIRVLGDARGRKLIGATATVLVFISFGISVGLLQELLKLPPDGRHVLAPLVPFGPNVPWIDVAPVQVYYRALLDPLSLLMCLIVTGVGGLIHLYATGYMAHDRDYPRFFAYFNLFIFAMLTLVLADSILLMFVGWEGVGLCSYLLISFWYEDANNAKAGNKAFIVNRVGDVGFALGIMSILAVFGTFAFYTPEGTGFLQMAARKTTAHGALTTATASLIAALLFIGACGKSAQFPLHIWLPDAMAGPTPVSALIHAATMVTAGVVMVCRLSVLFVQAPIVLLCVALIGLFTAVFAATIALTQTDIKKVLAYSTVSQLGYMFLGAGAGAFAAGMFHVTTHAFFKALLFLGAGSVIHALSGEQDMRRMGGLARPLRITYWTMVAGWAAIAGFPGLSGFWSKDEILGYAAGIPHMGIYLYLVGTATAFLTGFYMTRLMAKTFWSKPRYDEHHVHPHESPPSMTGPLVVLALLSIFGGLIGLPWANQIEHFLAPSFPDKALLQPHHGIPVPLGLAVGAMVAVAAMLTGIVAYGRHRDTGELLAEQVKSKQPLYIAASRLWFVDAAANMAFVTGGGRFAEAVWHVVDQGIVDRLVNAVAFVAGLLSEMGRSIQTGYVRTYMTTMLVGVVVLLIWVLSTVGGR